MNTLQKKLPSWFWIIGIVSLLWNIMGIFSFVGHTFISEEALALLSEKEQSCISQFFLFNMRFNNRKLYLPFNYEGRNRYY